MVKRRSMEQWRELIEEQETAGGTAAQFCRERGIDPQRFYQARHDLGKTGKRADRSGSGFVKVAPPDSTTTSSELNLHLSLGAVQLSLPAGVDPKWLATLLREVADAPVA